MATKLKVNINQAKNLVEKMVLSQIENGTHMPVYLHSSPGIGKSAIVRQIADKHDLGFVDIRMAQFEASDVAGVPFVKDEDGKQVMDISTPKWFPSKEAIAAGKFPEKGILFFDELSNAPIAVQHAGYRIILDRQVNGNAELGDGWVIVAAGNLKEDKTGAKPVAPALANRFAAHLEVEVNLEAFMAHAVANDFHETVIGFLNFAGHHLYTFDPRKQDMAFATPRSWEQVSNIMKVGFNDSELPYMIGGSVGNGVAAEFMSFKKYYAKLPDFERIMSGEEEYKVPKDSGVVYALTSSLIIHLAQNGNDDEKVKNLKKIMDQLDDDFVILVYKLVKSATENDMKTLANIFKNTRDTFNRVKKYLNMGEIEA